MPEFGFQGQTSLDSNLDSAGLSHPPSPFHLRNNHSKPSGHMGTSLTFGWCLSRWPHIQLCWARETFPSWDLTMSLSGSCTLHGSPLPWEQSPVLISCVPTPTPSAVSKTFNSLAKEYLLICDLRLECLFHDNSSFSKAWPPEIPPPGSPP